LLYYFVEYFQKELNYSCSKSFLPLQIDPDSFIAKVKILNTVFKSVPYVTTSSSWISFIKAQSSQIGFKVNVIPPTLSTWSVLSTGRAHGQTGKRACWHPIP